MPIDDIYHETHFVRRRDGDNIYWEEVTAPRYTRASVIEDVLNGQYGPADQICCTRHGRFWDASETLASAAFRQMTDEGGPDTIDDIPAFIREHAPDDVMDYFREASREAAHQMEERVA